MHKALIRTIASQAHRSNGGQVIELDNAPSETYRKVYRPSRDTESATALVDVDSEGTLLRIGRSLFVLDNLSNIKRFSALPKDVSLSIDNVTKYGNQVVVTSRERVNKKAYTQWIKSAKSQKADKHQVLMETARTSKTKDEPNSAATQIESSTIDNNCSARKSPSTAEVDADTDHDSTNTEFEDNSDETDDFSAAESWSDRSSEPGGDELAEDAAPVYTTAFREANLASEQQVEPSGNASSTFDSAESSADESSAESDEDRIMSYEREVDWSSENDGLFDRGDDFDDDEDIATYPEGFWSDYDGMHDDNMADSDDANDDLPRSKSKNKEVTNKPIKSDPIAQLDVFDCSEGGKPHTFHFARRYRQSISSSRPAVHPSKPFIVWPIGDQLVLFADTKHNSYFCRKLKSSQRGSMQVSVESHFSDNGKYLHMATLERRAAKAPPKNASASADPSYDLLISTYRLSSRKIARSPPLLIYRVKLDLGQLSKPDLAFLWIDDEVFVSCSAKRLTVFRIRLFRPQILCEPPVLVPRNTIELPDSAAKRAVHFAPMNAKTYAIVIVAPEPGSDREEGSTSELPDGAKDDGDKSEAKDDKKGPESLESGPRIETEGEQKYEESQPEKGNNEGTVKEEPRVVQIEDHPKDTYAVFVEEDKHLGGWVEPSLNTALKIKKDAGIGHFEMEAVEVDLDSDCC